MATPISEPSKVGKRATLIIPAKLRNRYVVKDGSLVIAEATPEEILVRPAIAMSMTLRDWDELRQVVQTVRETQ